MTVALFVVVVVAVVAAVVVAVVVVVGKNVQASQAVENYFAYS